MAQSESVPSLRFPDKMPAKFTGSVSVSASFSEHHSENAGVIVSKTMLVLRVEQTSVFAGKLKVCDYVVSVNGEAVSDKSVFYNMLKKIRRTGKQFTVGVMRPVWNVPAERLPDGYDGAPGYAYLLGLIVMYPGSVLGMSIKAYNNKVFVSHTDLNSVSASTCMVGDCIVDVNGMPVTTTKGCSEGIVAGLNQRKFVIVTLERPIDEMALRVAKYVLLVEKTAHKDPRMAADAMTIGTSEATRIKNDMVPGPTASILRASSDPSSNIHVTLRRQSLMTNICTEPFNPLLMQSVNPKRDQQSQQSQSSKTSSTSTSGAKA